MTYKKCPHCKGVRFSEIRDATLSYSVNEHGSWEKVRVDDAGSSHYMKVCDGCRSPLESNELV